MADNLPTNTNNSDEIDLGQLFHLIGKGFKKIGQSINQVFKWFFELLISMLLFFQKHFLKLIIVLIIGTVGGYFLDTIKSEKYISKMVVEPNFNSVQQLYNNIEFYDDLAKAEDSIALATALDITVGEASLIKRMFVDSYSDENQKIKLFDDFIKDLDSTTVKAIDYEAYLENFNSIDAKFHQIRMLSTNSFVAKKAQPAIIKSIARNNYFKLQKSISDKNIAFQDSLYRFQLMEIDSLQKLYKTVLVKEAEKAMQGTNINLAASGESKNKELALIEERDLLKIKLVELNIERANKAEILNVISDFPSRGVKEKGWLTKYVIAVPVLLCALVLVLLILLELNAFLKNYKK